MREAFNFFALSAFFAAKDGDGMAAKDAKVAKTGGRGLSAFALSAFSAAKNGDGMAAKDAKVAKTGGTRLVGLCALCVLCG